MKKIKINVLLVLLCSFIVLLSVEYLNARSRRPNPPPARICFTLDVSDCPGLSYAGSLKIKPVQKVERTLPNGKKTVDFVYGTEQSAFVTDIQEKYITGTKINCGFSSNTTVQSSWRELYYHHHKRYPTASELAGMSYKNAWDWFRDKYKTDSPWCFPNNPQYPDVDQGILNDEPVNPVPTKKTSTASICFDWIDPMIMPGDPDGQFLPFFAIFEIPNGGQWGFCQIKKVVAKSVIKPKEGQTLNIKLKVVQPCFICFTN